MTTAKASRPTRVKKKPLPKVSRPEPLVDENEIAKPTSIAAKPLIGADPELVTTVGLGNLKVTTANGILNNDRETNV